MLGAGDEPSVTLSNLRMAKQVRIGRELRFAFSLASASEQTQELVVDYAVHFVKANGESRPKVFKLRRLTLEPRAKVDLNGSVSFAQMTTRTHYPGRHRLEIIVNGRRQAHGSVVVER